MGQRRPTVGDEFADQHPIDLVEPRMRFLGVGHGRTVSGAVAWLSHVETWQLRAQFAAALSRMYGAEVPAYHDPRRGQRGR